MSLFPRSFISADPTTSFHPLFRLLDDFDEYSRAGETGKQRPGRTALKTFAPKFDVKELPDSYELHGELPGIEQKDVEIEFTDSSTLTVRGHTERSYSSGTPPAGLVEGSGQQGTITEGGEGKASEEKGKKGETSVEKSEGEKKPQAKYWVSERSVGEFSRTFSFPSRVDQDNVKASMKNGILSVIVPKSNKPESRKITIS
ncbi:HSP20-like chaperone [Glarea lozoyensis ATCC 20868]|uniref:HSP20-like chaperone n=1 Tax=Glarea lozoyensis (strain ATCC 20868 / MF5171) TaxID=1116229 RepID=S3DE21_GLAL2|nr:HSP20-like chaperone [Glarea lozoyensis ATCC 20868]EPE24893.1 HSP20-like chaperone [Glarea lozoyensis ATCC 20868]